MKYFYFVILFILTGCAQIAVLTGGPKDEFAPSIDSVKSFPSNGELNYTGDLVRLKFDEYITLIKPQDNILITPRQNSSPTITSHNKTLEIIFNEPLLENTTYTINFNRAVADITEKNDSIFQYVFSTGNYIDSLSVSGKVTDAFTNNAASGILVALYPANNEISFDSIPHKTKPMYISQSDKLGNFKLNYLKYGVYYLFAIEDKNKNLLLDENEKLAFLPEQSVLVNSNTEAQNLKLFLPENSSTGISKTKFTSPGKIELIFESVPENFTIKTSCNLLQEDTKKADSLIYWLAVPPTPKMRFVIEMDEMLDTLKPVYKVDAEESVYLEITSNVQNGKLMPDQKLEIIFSEPIDTSKINNSGIRMINKDSVEVEVKWEIINLRTLRIETISEQIRTFFLDSASVFSIFGKTNQSVSFTFSNEPKSYYGSLMVNADTTFNVPAIVYLLNSKNEIVDTINFGSHMSFENLVPGDYQLMVVLDENNDGIWTTGSLPQKRIPEKVIYFNEAINVKSKWEKEIDWLLKRAL